jgi:hypothetical protein
MGIRRLFLKRLPLFFIVGCGIYIVVGYGKLYFLDWSTTLVEYAIHPDDNEKKWRLLPFVDKVSLAILKGRSPEIIQQDFSHIGLTLGAVVGGFRYHSRELTPEQRQKSKELAVLMHNKGVGAGIEFVDAGGCTALQGAIVGKDVYVARTLLEIGGAAATVANPNAKLKSCRLDAYTLAKEKAFPLPPLNGK